MKILVIASNNAGSQKAHAINLFKMADGFQRCGHHVLLITKKSIKKIDRSELYEIYGMSTDIQWIQIPNFLGDHLLFSIAALPFVILFSPEIIYTRHYESSWLFTKTGFSVVAETHVYPDNNTKELQNFIKATHSPNFKELITINEILGDSFLQRGCAEKIQILPDAVDPKLFERPDILPPSPYLTNKKIIAYAGHLYDYKGIRTILGAAKELPDIDFYLIGGLPEDIEKQRKKIEDLKLKNVFLEGLKPHTEVPKYLWHADILLLPPNKDHPSAKWTSPLKAGEYLISGTPVIASDIPGLRRWFASNEVEYVPPDDSHEMALAILRLLSDEKRREFLRNNGLRWAHENTYAKRAEKILNLIL